MLHIEYRATDAKGYSSEIYDYSAQVRPGYVEFQAHKDHVRAVAFSPDGKWLATAGKDGRLQIWDWSLRSQSHDVRASDRSLHCLAWTPDGRRVILGDEAGAVQSYSLDTERLRELGRHEESVWPMSLSPDGRYLASGSRDGIIHVRQLDKPQHPTRLQGHTWVITGLGSYVHQGQTHLVSVSYDKTLRIWNLGNGKVVLTQDKYPLLFRGLSVAPNVPLAVSGTRDGTLQVWNLENGEVIRLLVGHKGGIACVAVHSEGRYALSTSYDNTVRLWDLKRGKEIQRFEFASPIVAADFSPDGLFVALGDQEGKVRVQYIYHLVR
ncbi:MAG: WD40 repeat domain-containing protein [Gemmatales bacterium]|nr:WD40 repeat domain-containing protein [Gemmatales bacterium]MDW7993919.1 WD40 repeat domain-containing protein [Gemmatales bacterium]